MTVKNLWGDLSGIMTVRTPQTILSEQAELLTKAMHGKLVGHVEEFEVDTEFNYDFIIKLPALQNYKYSLLHVSYPVELYPVRLFSSAPETNVICQDEEQFERELSKILSSDEVRTILSRLISQLS